MKKSVKKPCIESGFSFLSDFLAMRQGHTRKSAVFQISFFRWAATLSTPRKKRLIRPLFLICYSSIARRTISSSIPLCSSHMRDRIG